MFKSDAILTKAAEFPLPKKCYEKAMPLSLEADED
jgi:hypothetical protein